jgi:hypothetical protein
MSLTEEMIIAWMFGSGELETNLELLKEMKFIKENYYLYDNEIF